MRTLDSKFHAQKQGQARWVEPHTRHHVAKEMAKAHTASRRARWRMLVAPWLVAPARILLACLFDFILPCTFTVLLLRYFAPPEFRRCATLWCFDACFPVACFVANFLRVCMPLIGCSRACCLLAGSRAIPLIWSPLSLCLPQLFCCFIAFWLCGFAVVRCM